MLKERDASRLRVAGLEVTGELGGCRFDKSRRAGDVGWNKRKWYFLNAAGVLCLMMLIRATTQKAQNWNLRLTPPHPSPVPPFVIKKCISATGPPPFALRVRVGYTVKTVFFNFWFFVVTSAGTAYTPASKLTKIIYVTGDCVSDVTRV